MRFLVPAILLAVVAWLLLVRKETYLSLGRFTSPPAPSQLTPGYTGYYTGALVPEDKKGPLTWTGLPFLWSRV